MAHSIRAVTKGDVPGVVELVREVLAEFGITFGVGAETDTQLLGLPASYEAEGGAFFVAEDGGVITGTAGVVVVEPGVFELRKMYLRPSTRGHGVGQALFDRCLGFVRAEHAKRLTLDTTEQMTAAIRFYEKNGFVRDDTQRRASRCSRGYRLDLA
jgi:putative acetyltransferase